MLLIDDILAAPLRALFFVLKEINTVVQAERAELDPSVRTVWTSSLGGVAAVPTA
jgi:hypothetical protein